MIDLRMLSIVDRVELRFLAVEGASAEWWRMDDKMVGVRIPAETGSSDPEADECDMLY